MPQDQFPQQGIGDERTCVGAEASDLSKGGGICDEGIHTACIAGGTRGKAKIKEGGWYAVFGSSPLASPRTDDMSRAPEVQAKT